ncbi:MAG: hydroxymethylglutaryl-CoA lyase [Rhodospirillales bacterium]|nr:hydroxymethylglutaryl-CoA lyase [Rhodospirillales bacterium]
MSPSLPRSVRLLEVGPREGFQFEGIGKPDKIRLEDKARLIEMLSRVGLKALQIVSFVNPRQVPQMADAEEICRRLSPVPGVTYSGIYLNDTGLRRALAAGNLKITGKVTLTASESFALRNQRRMLAQDFEMQRKMAALYREHGYAVETGSVMAAFGCNYEGKVPLARLLELVARLQEVAAEVDSTLRTVTLADTMGWANPEQIRRSVVAIRERWPELAINLHLHDTRGLGIANVYAALIEGVDRFDTAVAGLGGCPFAGHRGAAGNVCTEEVVFLCRELGIATGIDLEALIECARFAETIVGHPLPSSLLHARVTPVPAEPVAA